MLRRVCLMAPSGNSPPVDFGQYRARRLRVRLLELLDALLAAVGQRDLARVWRVLDEDDAIRWFPPGVREEALTFVRLPPASLRAPLRLYRFHHQLTQLADEPLEQGEDPSQLTLDLAAPGESRAAICFPGPPTAPPDDPFQGGGADRRRSGSR